MSENLEKLIDENGIEAVNKLLFEYNLMIMSKAMLCDRIAELLNNPDVTIDDIKALLESGINEET